MKETAIFKYLSFAKQRFTQLYSEIELDNNKIPFWIMLINGKQRIHNVMAIIISNMEVLNPDCTTLHCKIQA